MSWSPRRRTQGEVAEPTPSKISPFLAVHHGARTCGRKKNESRVSRGVMSTNSWDFLSAISNI